MIRTQVNHPLAVIKKVLVGNSPQTSKGGNSVRPTTEDTWFVILGRASLPHKTTPLRLDVLQPHSDRWPFMMALSKSIVGRARRIRTDDALQRKIDNSPRYSRRMGPTTSSGVVYCRFMGWFRGFLRSGRAMNFAYDEKNKTRGLGGSKQVYKFSKNKTNSIIILISFLNISLYIIEK